MKGELLSSQIQINPFQCRKKDPTDYGRVVFMLLHPLFPGSRTETDQIQFAVTHTRRVIRITIQAALIDKKPLFPGHGELNVFLVLLQLASKKRMGEDDMLEFTVSEIVERLSQAGAGANHSKVTKSLNILSRTIYVFSTDNNNRFEQGPLITHLKTARRTDSDRSCRLDFARWISTDIAAGRWAIIPCLNHVLANHSVWFRTLYLLLAYQYKYAGNGNSFSIYQTRIAELAGISLSTMNPNARRKQNYYLKKALTDLTSLNILSRFKVRPIKYGSKIIDQEITCNAGQLLAKVVHLSNKRKWILSRK